MDNASTSKPLFRTPEDVAPELGMSRTELRRYCRESGIHTRLSNRRIVLHEDDIRRLVQWVRDRSEQKKGPRPGEIEPDAFA